MIECGEMISILIQNEFLNNKKAGEYSPAFINSKQQKSISRILCHLFICHHFGIGNRPDINCI